ncbi:YceD family protein [Oscillatoria sp. CS-180]|uniref:YceD family protein n=1 Tax=Oscillatoria sp. CS-180 TaxID=3021720 RepID=UPI00232DC7CE|nr:YceD family protein [Oscillatoria sp. CS-180]MDB9528207.1 YceD family protein [Oscillatoria sp. CS-180]
MQAIYIPHLLNAVDRTRSLIFETTFRNLATLTPVRAEVSVRHGTTFLDVQGSAQTIVTLTCDRCLCQYNHRVAFDAKEIIWLDESVASQQDIPLEQEVNPEELVESLSPYGYFDPETWIYEQVCLELPQRQICNASCPGLIVESKAANSSPPKVDDRWSALEVLKQQLAKDESHRN